MHTGTCHCGAVRIEVPRRPARATCCNCSICRRYGTLWGYYRASSVRIDARPEDLEAYAWGERRLRFVRCATCGCVTHWEPVQGTAGSRMGINMRNFTPELLARVRIRHLDGASTWTYLD